MNEINELIESLILDVAEEGVGTSAGIALLWALFIGGGFAAFTGLLNLLSSMI